MNFLFRSICALPPVFLPVVTRETSGILPRHAVLADSGDGGAGQGDGV
jgi:hypothetical protein